MFGVYVLLLSIVWTVALMLVERATIRPLYDIVRSNIMKYDTVTKQIDFKTWNDGDAIQRVMYLLSGEEPNSALLLVRASSRVKKKQWS